MNASDAELFPAKHLNHLAGTAAKITFNPVNNRLYVANGSSVLIYDAPTRSLLGTAQTGYVFKMAVDPVTNNVYASTNDALLIINGNANALAGNFPTGGLANLIFDINPLHRRLYLGSTNASAAAFSLSSYNPDTQQTIRLGD